MGSVISQKQHEEFISPDTCIKPHFLYDNKGSKLEDVYTVEPQILGHGASGYVRLCRNENGEEFAVKTIALDRSKLSTISMLNKEIEALRKVKGHANVLNLVHVFEEEDHVHIITDLAEGGELFKKIISETTFSESSIYVRLLNYSTRNACEIFVQACKAMKHVHSKSVIHRDLKPENLLLAEKNCYDIKIADFGLARILHDRRALHKLETNKVLEEEHAKLMKTACGTRIYAAPEVQEHKYYDEKVDVWSLGVILFIMLAGEMPFDSIADVVAVDFTDKWDRESWKCVSSSAVELLKQILVKDPKKRPTINKILKHGWIMEVKQKDEIPLPGICKHLRMLQFNKTAQLEAAMYKSHGDQLDKFTNIFMELSEGRGDTANFLELKNEVEKVSSNVASVLKPTDMGQRVSSDEEKKEALSEDTIDFADFMRQIKSLQNKFLFCQVSRRGGVSVGPSLNVRPTTDVEPQTEPRTPEHNSSGYSTDARTNDSSCSDYTERLGDINEIKHAHSLKKSYTLRPRQ